MNKALLKAKMDEFFANVSPEYLVEEFEKLGYTFVDLDIDWSYPKIYGLSQLSCNHEKRGLFSRIMRFRKRNNNQNKLTSEYPGSFFCLKLYHEGNSNPCGIFIY